MLAIARYALKTPYHAASMVGILAILSLFIPLVSILSGALVGLIILTQGLISGTRVIVVSMIGVSIVSYLMTQSPELGIVIGLVQWLPMMVLAEVLRRTRSLSFSLVVGMGLAMLTVAIQFLFWPDSQKLWMQVLIQFFEASGTTETDLEQIRPGLENLVYWMSIMLVAVMFSTFIATLLLARWFQSRLADSDSYRNEFYGIRLGQSIAIMALVILVASLILRLDWLLSMLSVVLATFLYQGLAIAHSWSKARGKSMLLYILYVLMIIFPHMLGLTALLGVLDNWIDFRKRLKSVPE
ncbi:MAG: DUF2232 domain-containing protein [Gammaproteobacteria bacterium]|nr:DUF2232 domain-containing protein [Gammaproteobacteria bacterium]